MEGFPDLRKRLGLSPFKSPNTMRKKDYIMHMHESVSYRSNCPPTPETTPSSHYPLRFRNKSLFSKATSLCLVLCSISMLSSKLPLASAKSPKTDEKRVVCYYTNWSAYRQGPAKFLPDNINPYLCTHLVYAFGGLTSESGIKPFDKYQDIDKGGYTKFNGLKTYNKALKTMIAIGGWNEGSRRFSNLVSDLETRKTFIKHAIRFLRQYQFDGLDLDWEYPASREGGVPEDKKNYAQFIKELRESFEEESKSTGRARLLLTVAVPAGIEWIQKGFDIPTINRNIDFFNLLTYDYHASTEPNANHHAPLKARDGISEYDWKGQLNIEYTINFYLKEGADPDKLVVGLPTYGRSYNLFNVDSYDIDAPSSGPGTKGKYTKEPGYLAYYEICEGVKSGDWRVENAESDTQGPHAVKGDQWVGYDDTRMMAIKSKWVKENGLGGIMFWSVDNDDFRGICHGKPFPLIEAAKLAYLTGDAPTLSSNRQTTSKLNRPSLNKNNRFSTSLSNRRVTTPTPPKTTTGAPSKPRRNKNRRNKKNKTTTVATTTTSTTPPPPTTTFNPLSTPEPPTTPDPGVDFECKDDGFFPHPRECKKYFWCLDAPGLGLVAHHFTCPAGLFFNKNTDSCDYARNVACKDKNAASPAAATTAATTTTTTTKATTTSRPTTTTTTTEAPEEEYDDEEYEDEEEIEEPKVSTLKFKSKPVEEDNGRSVKEINDIKDLLKLIRKLGGVEELEKYLNENPNVAAAIEEFEDEEEKPKASTSSSLFTRNRFTPSTATTSSTNSRTRIGSSPIAASSLKYTSIQRNRPSTTTTSAPDLESEEEEDPVPSPQPKKKLSFNTNSRPKYVTLSRNSKQTDANSDNTKTDETTTSTTTTEKSTTTKEPSSTETSIVVRFSRDDEKLLDEISLTKNKTSAESAETMTDDKDVESDENNRDDDADDNERYVTISRPYAQVSGSSAISAHVPLLGSSSSPSTPTSRLTSSSSNTFRYVQLSRTRSTTSSVQSTTEASKNVGDTAEDEASEEYESEEDPEEKSVVEIGAAETQKPSTPKITTAKTTTESPTSTYSTSTKSTVRIPTRKTNGFVSRTRGSTTSTTTPPRTTTVVDSLTSGDDSAASRKTRNFAVGNRRNLFQSRTRGNSTSPPAEASRSVTANEESKQVVDLLTGAEIYTSLDEKPSNEIQTQPSRPRSRSIGRSSYKATSTTPSSISDVRTRSRSRFRSTTEKSLKEAQIVNEAPIVFRRRIKAKTTTAPATTTTTTTTRRPTTIAPKTTTQKDEEEAEYYYYYYDEDEEPNLPQVLSTKDLFQKSPTQRTNGLRTETFTPSTSTVQLHQHQQLLATPSDRGFAKRNLESQPPPPKPTVQQHRRQGKEIKNTLHLNTNNFVAPVLSNHKWSDRAVVPLSEKIRLKGDGSVECMDKGIFPHPVSCKQFVHCVSGEENDGSIRAWVYSCPQLLTFDPVGGMCNYDEFANNKKGPGGNSCIE